MKVSFVPAEADAEFVRRFEASFIGGMDDVLTSMGVTRDELDRALREVGEIRAVIVDGETAGSIWIELRDRTLHIHAILLDERFRGRGIGRIVLELLEQEFAGRADELELGVQEGNVGAERLYESTGFREEDTRPELGFRILRKTLRE